MAEQQSTLFRKEALQKITAPEQLTDYLKVTNPGIWLVLIAVIVLLIGLFAWCIVGKLETVNPCIASVKDGTAQIYVTDTTKGEVTEGMTVRIDGHDFTINRVDRDDYGRMTAYAPVNVNNGSYNVDVIVESISPIKFLID
ncbi:hypothetical protein SAMN02910456_01006 [Ruminococcaceae bacterium YRB3002]|nr:hypothetical protein SAMN02910456_01006 [Ruminococcaceae bacterium YRB3002]